MSDAGSAHVGQLSPDGRLHWDGPDLKPLAKLATGFDAAEVWVSGDGQTIYATSEDGKRLAVMRADGTSTKLVSLPRLATGFVASEHG